MAFEGHLIYYLLNLVATWKRCQESSNLASVSQSLIKCFKAQPLVVYKRTPESTPRSLMTCLDKNWAFFVKSLRAVWIKFDFFKQNATSKNWIKIGSRNIGIRSVWIKLMLQARIEPRHTSKPVQLTLPIFKTSLVAFFVAKFMTYIF